VNKDKVMRPSLRRLTAAAVIAIAPASASAATVTLSQQTNVGAYGGIFGGNGHAAVSVTSASAPATTYNGVGGGFDLVGSDGIGAFTAFCIDLMQYLILPASYITSAMPNTFPDSRVATLERLFETGYKGLDLTDNTKSAGFQLAVWEIAFETGSVYDINNGNFKSNLLSPGNAAAAFAQTLLIGLSGPVTQNYELSFFLSGTRQDLVSVSAVPLPAAGLLLVAGLGGLAALRRKRKALAPLAVA